VELKLSYLDALLSRKPHARLVIMGHSVGAYILMQVGLDRFTAGALSPLLSPSRF
jgi:alpha-beta hydrolase superfamily lysophospholipase